MSTTASFLQKHLSSNDITTDEYYHRLEISAADFHDLEINFYPGFAERNAFLGDFESKRKDKNNKKKAIDNDHTPLPDHEHNNNNNPDTFQNAINLLQNIPIGSRLRHINYTDCEDMSYSSIMTLLASELVQCLSCNIILKFEDVRHIQLQEKVKNCHGAVMAWHVKQETLGLNFSKNMLQNANRHYCCSCNCSHITHSCVRDIVDSWYVTLLVYAVILYDLSIFFYVESHRLFWNIPDGIKEYESDLVIYLTLLALTLYSIEIIFRIYGYGKHFDGTPINNKYDLNNFSQKHSKYCSCCVCFKYLYGYITRGCIEFTDLFIIFLSFLLTIVDIIYVDSKYLPFFYEILRLLRIIMRIIFQLSYTAKCIRLIVRVNRQTYFDASFDLDLCYIVYPRYLVMSWPSLGIESLYRNPLGRVAKFLNKYHGDNYLIFDLCLERSYDDILFNGRVMRSRAMTDHSVCSLSDMFEFAQLVHLFLQHNPIHCAVIHCKGGKGRTGVMVCACIMYDYRQTTVDEALEYFATMRTNITKTGKLQGVETPSQLRYCKYFYQLLHITDVLKFKSHSIAGNALRDKSISHSQNTKDFYNMIIAASPQQNANDNVDGVENDSDAQIIELKIQETETLIIDPRTRVKISKHLSDNDLNISGLKQNKHKLSSSTMHTNGMNGKRMNKTSDVGISTLKLDKNKLYVRGQWETSNPSLQSMLLLHQRFKSNFDEKNDKSTHKLKASIDKNNENKKHKDKKREYHRHKSASEAWLARQRDTTVIAQSIAQSSPTNIMRKKFNNKPLINTTLKIGQYSTDSTTLDEATDDEDEESKTESKLSNDVDIICDEDLDYKRDFDDEHLISVGNESYLSELFLKQPVIMKLKYVSIGPIVSDEWHNKSIFWKIQICMKRDFDYVDSMKVYEFKYYKIEQENFHKMKFSAFDNLTGGKRALSLNGNICFKIFRCKREGSIITDKKIKDEFGDSYEKMIGSIWIHSHFIPANYKKEIDQLIFRKHEIDGMYKDKKNKTSIPQSFAFEIGYRCSRINNNAIIENYNNTVKIATV